MSQRRMFSPQIIDSDAFLDMPVSTQNLYFHLGMRADDDGFVSSPKKIIRLIGGTEDDLKVLLAKRFLLSFDDGIVVIKHWRINNYIRSDRYKETTYLEQKNILRVKENGSFTLDEEQGEHISLVPWKSDAEKSRVAINKGIESGIPTGIPLGDAGKVRLGKVRLGKDKTTEKISVDPLDLELATQLYNLIMINTSTFKKPNLEKWADHVRLMRERDNRTIEQINFLIKWSQKHDFWASNILSTAKLRYKFDTLVAQVKRDFKGRTGGSKGKTIIGFNL